MPRNVLNARLHILGLVAIWAGWMFTTGVILGQYAVQAAFTGPTGAELYGSAAFTVLLVALVWVLLNARLPELARRGRAWPVRIVGLSAALGLLGLGLGFATHFPQALGSLQLARPDLGGLMLARGTAGVVGMALILLAPIGDPSPAPFFLVSRRHVSDEIARRSLLAAAGHALVVALAVHFALSFPTEPGGPYPFPRVLWHGAIAYLMGILLSLWQRYPQRAIAWVPLGGLLAVIALLAAWAAPGAEWPVLLLGLGLGVGHTPPRNDLLASLPPSQRTAGLAIMALAQLLGVAAGLAIIAALPSEDVARPIRFLLAFLLTGLAVYGYFRELIEQFVEPILGMTNPIRGYGPGLTQVPTRGPVLVIANHCAWFDPLWLAKLIPVRLRPMMTSKFYDLPLISWLMRRVFHSIRVLEVGFRREAPEIHEAIAALDRGENVLIFPEGWLKRREEQSLRRFGQGVYQILRDKPQTPVVVCWIEGGWGSYASYWNGPPTKNKKLDFLHRIRIGISEPVVLSLEMLHDHWQTRRYLMQACLHARTFLGLPELPPPPFAADDHGDEANHKVEQET